MVPASLTPQIAHLHFMSAPFAASTAGLAGLDPLLVWNALRAEFAFRERAALF